MLRAEFLKMKRSSVWLMVVLLPVLAVVTGSINYVNNPNMLGQNWASFSSQITLFYGFIFYSVGIAIIVASLWRMEHRGNNWNPLLSNSSAISYLLLTKMMVAFALAAAMQVVLVAGGLLSGLLVVRVPEGNPWNFVLVSIFATVGALPLIALQTLFSALLKSFAVPVALCVAGCVLGIASVTSFTLRPLSYVLPQGLITRTMSLGSTALAGSVSLSVLDALALVACSLVVFAFLFFIAVYAVRSIQLR